MKNVQLLVLAVCIVLTAPMAFAQTKVDEHEAHHPDKKIAAPAATQKDSEGPAGAAAMQPMQQNMKTMHEVMEKIQSSSDPAEKAELLKQHLQAMHDQMKMMLGMSGGMMMGMTQGGMGSEAKKRTNGTAMSCGKKGMKPGDMMMKCHQMMQARMDMMQDMMGQMLEHEEAEQGLERGK